MFVIVRLDRTIQYSGTFVMKLRTRGVLDTRRSLSSGAHSRDPVAGMTAVGGVIVARMSGAIYGTAADPHIAPLIRATGFAPRNDGGGKVYTGKCGVVFGCSAASASLSSGRTSS
jgi:hypothetical protein